MEKMNGRYPKPYKWNEQSQKCRATNCSYWEGLNHQKCNKVRKHKWDRFGCKLKQPTKKAKKIECPFDLKEMKEFFKCRADFEQATKNAQ